MSMYADDSTLYMSATTVTEMTATLNKELPLVSEWVARNKLVLNISKTKCHALTLGILFILYVWLGQGVTRVGKSMFSISLCLAVCVCGSQSEAAVYHCL